MNDDTKNERSCRKRTDDVVLVYFHCFFFLLTMHVIIYLNFVVVVYHRIIFGSSWLLHIIPVYFGH